MSRRFPMSHGNRALASVRTRENVTLSILAENTGREKLINRFRHDYFAARLVLCCSRLQSNYTVCDTDLADLEAEHFRDAPTIRSLVPLRGRYRAFTHGGSWLYR